MPKRMLKASNGQVADAVEAIRYKKGDRIQRVGWTQCGIVRQVRRGSALVWWGTDQLGERLDWVRYIDLEPYPCPVKT